MGLTSDERMYVETHCRLFKLESVCMDVPGENAPDLYVAKGSRWCYDDGLPVHPCEWLYGPEGLPGKCERCQAWSEQLLELGSEQCFCRACFSNLQRLTWTLKIRPV